MQHFTKFADLGVAGLDIILKRAMDWKQKSPGAHLSEMILGMVFFNPSLRTRVSFETSMLRGGGHAVVLDVGKGTWDFEYETGVIMNGEKPEHVCEAIPVLGRYVDALGVRSFAGLVNDDDDANDKLINKFRDLAGVPIISMESAREHPCQGLADLLTIRENYGKTKGVSVTLTWAPHIKPLPKAVPHSFLLSAAAAGCDVRVAHPPGFELHAGVMDEARGYASESGGSITVTHDRQAAFDGSQVVYAKSWGPSSLRPEDGQLAAVDFASFRNWMITADTLKIAAGDAIFMHCLPVRRNVVATDDVLDGTASRVIDEAENRFHVQRVILDALLNSNN